MLAEHPEGLRAGYRSVQLARLSCWNRAPGARDRPKVRGHTADWARARLVAAEVPLRPATQAPPLTPAAWQGRRSGADRPGQRGASYVVNPGRREL